MGPVVQMYEASNKTGAVDSFLQAVVSPEYRSVLDHVLPGAFAQAVTDADTFFRIELTALEEWSFTQADAGRITQPVLAVLGGAVILSGQGGARCTNWCWPGCPRRRPLCSLAQHTGYR
jgi:hypothetical protein